MIIIFAFVAAFAIVALSIADRGRRERELARLVREAGGLE